MIHHGFKKMLMVCLLLLLAGCAQLRTSIVTTADMNKDINGQPSPIVVKIYELSQADAFNQGNFFTLFDSPQTALQSQLLNTREVVLAPAETKHVWLSLNPQTRYVGIVAGYRQLNNTTWRAVISVPAQKSTQYMGLGLDISLSASGVSVREGAL